MSYQIEDGVPVPKRTAGRKGSKYPFAVMQPGQSFFADDVKVATVRSAVGAFTKRHADEGFKFSVRAEGDGVRVWRV